MCRILKNGRQKYAFMLLWNSLWNVRMKMSAILTRILQQERRDVLNRLTAYETEGIGYEYSRKA